MALRGQEWRFPIHGYDSRDLLRGHYLTFRVEWGVGEGSASTCRWCCICLERKGTARYASYVECCSATHCDVRLSAGDERDLSRFYIPEAEASKLEQVVRSGKAEIVFIERRGQLSIKELLIDGRSRLQ